MAECVHEFRPIDSSGQLACIHCNARYRQAVIPSNIVANVSELKRLAAHYGGYAEKIMRQAATEIEQRRAGETSVPLSVSDSLSECARAYAGDTGLWREHPLWAAIEAYDAARRNSPDVCVCGQPNTPGVQHRTDGPCFVLETAEEPAEIAGARLVGHTADCALVRDISAARCTCDLFVGCRICGGGIRYEHEPDCSALKASAPPPQDEAP